MRLSLKNKNACVSIRINTANGKNSLRLPYMAEKCFQNYYHTLLVAPYGRLEALLIGGTITRAWAPSSSRLEAPLLLSIGATGFSAKYIFGLPLE